MPSHRWSPLVLLLAALGSIPARAEDPGFLSVARRRSEVFLEELSSGRTGWAVGRWFDGSALARYDGAREKILEDALDAFFTKDGELERFEEVALEEGPEGYAGLAYVLHARRSPCYLVASYVDEEPGARLRAAEILEDHDEAVRFLGSPHESPPASVRSRCETFLDSLGDRDVEKAFRELALEEDRSWWKEERLARVQEVRSEFARLPRRSGASPKASFVRAQAIGGRVVWLSYWLDLGEDGLACSFTFHSRGDDWHVVDARILSRSISHLFARWTSPQ